MSSKRKESDPSCYSTALSSKKPKLWASPMKRADVEALGIFYAKSPISVSDLLTELKRQKCRTVFPDIAQWFLKQTKERLTFTLDTEKIEDEDLLNFEVQEKLDYLEDCQRTFQEYRNRMRKDVFLDDPLNNVLFNEWISSVRRFLQKSEEMVTLVNFPPQEITTDGKLDSSAEEFLFQELFSRFSEIFFLDPVLGRKTKDKDISSVPDLRFLECRYRGTFRDQPLLCMFCEVKREKTRDPVPGSSTDDGWLSMTLSEKILGHVGMELVSECYNSTFLPNVLGIVFVRTKVMFVFLEIKTEHVKAIHNNEDTEGKKATIHYTKTYDIFQADSRSEILELMFWLGCVQKNSYKRYYLKQ